MEQPSILSKAYNCDCLEYMRKLPDNYFDLAIADPPYGIGASRPSKKPSNILQKNGSIMSASVTDFGTKDWDDDIPTQEFFDELRRVSKNQIIWGANYFGLQGGMIVWDKINGNSDQYDCEIAYQSFNKRTDLVHYMWNGMFQGKYCGRDIRQAAVQQGNKALNEKRIHPTQKPVILYEWLLNNYAKKGDRIFDPMMGSQSSRIAAYQLGFNYVGCELDKEYFEKGCIRFNSMFSNNNKAVGGGIQTASKDMDNKYSEEMQEAKAKLFNTIMEAKKDLGDEISITPTEISENGDKHILTEILPDFESPFEDQNIIGGVSHSGDEDCVHNLALCLENVNDTEALGKAVHEAHVKHLEQDAKQAIHDRIVTPSARSFTANQVEILNRYHQVAAPDTPAGEAFRELLHKVAQEPDVARKPEKWVADTAKELDGIAEGITRDQDRGLHK